MFLARSEGYKGKQYQSGFIDFFIAGNFYGVISFEDGTSEEDGKKLLELFKEGLISADIRRLSFFDHVVSDLILKLNFPAHVGLAIGMLCKGALYIKTVGEGQICFRRGNTFDELLSGDKTASGYIKQFDLAIFTTTKIQELIGKTQDIQAFVEVAKPANILQKLHDQEYGEEDQGFVGLFVEFSQIEDPSPILPSIDTPQSQSSPQVAIGSEQPQTIISIPETNVSSSTSVDLRPSQESFDKGSLLSRVLGLIRTKQFTMILAVIILAVLIWSVIFGNQRRESAKIQEHIKTVSVEIDQKLFEAEEEVFMDMDKSLVLISDAKTLVIQLKKDLGDRYSDEIAKLDTKIQESESKIVRKESKEFDEFYDLTLENKDASGTIIAKEKEFVAILDAKQNTIYVLDIKNKSLTEYAHKEVSSAVAIGIYRESVFFVTQKKGIYKFTSQSKVNNIVREDSWKNIVDMDLYNGNIYILDEAGDEIYKFLVTEGGYSDKKSYFSTGQAIDLAGATGMTIDSAIYISTRKSVQKYISGVREKFLPNFPNTNTSFDHIYTDRDLEQLYVLDRENATVYILTKEGEYQRQIQSSIFAKANAMFVYDNFIYTLNNEKIYTVSLD